MALQAFHATLKSSWCSMIMTWSERLVKALDSSEKSAIAACMTTVDRSITNSVQHWEKGSVYEAQQFLKTVYHRFRSRKLLDESKELLQIAACIQLQHNEARSKPFVCWTSFCGLFSVPFKMHPHPIFHQYLYDLSPNLFAQVLGKCRDGCF